jgi:MoxR-like ATPase
VRALTEGRAHASFADVRHFAVEALQHRIILNYDGQAENIAVADLVEELLEEVSEDG